MSPDVIIAEALDDLRRHSAEKVVPKFWDPQGQKVHFGTRRRSDRAVLAEIDAHLGTYPVMSTTMLQQWVLQRKDAPPLEPQVVFDNRAMGCDLYDFIQDRQASMSLWSVPLDHACVPENQSHRAVRTEAEERRTIPTHKYAPKGKLLKPRLEGEEEGNPASLSIPELTRPYFPLAVPLAPSHGDSSLGNMAIRLALDFRTPNDEVRRRTGTIIFRGRRDPTEDPNDPVAAQGPIGWTVCWDCPEWFAGVRVGLSFPIGQAHGTGTPSNPIEVRDDEGRFAFLVWMWEMPMKGLVAMEGGTDAGSEWRIVSMLCKKQEGWMPVAFTDQEKHAFGIGRSRYEVGRDSAIRACGKARQQERDPP